LFICPRADLGLYAGDVVDEMVIVDNNDRLPTRILLLLLLLLLIPHALPVIDPLLRLLSPEQEKDNDDDDDDTMLLLRSWWIKVLSSTNECFDRTTTPHIPPLRQRIKNSELAQNHGIELAQHTSFFLLLLLVVMMMTTARVIRVLTSLLWVGYWPVPYRLYPVVVDGPVRPTLPIHLHQFFAVEL